MFKNFRDKIALSGITVLMIGVSLLIFTFVSAYGFLTQSLSIIPTADFTSMFGEALAPIIVTCIRIMYLGVMGWVSSLITIRGVTIIAHAPAVPTPVAPQQPVAEPKLQPQPQPQKPKLVEKPKAEKPKEEKPKEVVKPPEPEIIVIPPEEIAQPQPPQPEQPKQPQQPQSNGAPQQSSNS